MTKPPIDTSTLGPIRVEPPRPDAVTAAEINALPNRVRRYIHDLETRCDPSGDVQTIWSQREQIAGLIKRLQELSPPVDDRVIAHATAEGSFVTGDDGFVVYWPKDSKGGAYTARILRVLADELDRRNEKWAADLERYLAKEGPKDA